MDEDTRRVALVVGALAAAAGVAAASYFFFRRTRADEAPKLKNVSEILSDCYSKIREIQRSLSDLQATTLPQPSPSSTSA